MLQISHIQHYPIGKDNALKMIGKEGTFLSKDLFYLRGFHINRHGSNECLLERVDNHAVYKVSTLADVSPILRPVSDLFKKIDGKVGAFELGKIINPNVDWFYNDVCNFPINSVDGMLGWTFSDPSIEGSYFYYEQKEYKYQYIDQLSLFKYLFENHYDVFGLIEKELANDVNTLEI